MRKSFNMKNLGAYLSFSNPGRGAFSIKSLKLDRARNAVSLSDNGFTTCDFSGGGAYLIKLFLFFPIGISLLLTSCLPPLNQGAAQSPPPIERREPKQPDPIKQEDCRQKGQTNCEGNKKCEDICDDIFRGKEGRQDCYEYSSEMVFEFENLLKAAENGRIDRIEEIGHLVLECMLDIDEREFAKAIREMSQREAQKFAFLIASDDIFAEVLSEEDDEFNILKQLLNELSGSNELEEALSQEVEDDKTLLWLFAEYSDFAWEWLDSYVNKECDGRDSEDCPGGEKIGAYCNALLESGFSDNEWKDFLADASSFEDDYKRDVESEEYEYKITDSPSGSGDFRDYCKLQTNSGNNDQDEDQDGEQDDEQDGDPDDDPPPPPTACPEGEDLSNSQILTSVHLERHSYGLIGGPKDYIHSDFRDSNDNNPDDRGSSTQQNILLALFIIVTAKEGGAAQYTYDSLRSLVLNESQVPYDSAKTYYLYLETKHHGTKKYNLRPELSSYQTGNGLTLRSFLMDSTLEEGIPLRTHVAIASELDGAECEFYTP